MNGPRFRTGFAATVALVASTVVLTLAAASAVMTHVAHDQEERQLNGGTGRFADATGTITVERVLDHAAGTSSGTNRGTLVVL